jgi:hypothetical protein
MCSAGAAVAVGRKASEGTRRGEYSPEKRGRTGAVVRAEQGSRRRYETERGGLGLVSLMGRLILDWIPDFLILLFFKKYMI